MATCQELQAAKDSLDAQIITQEVVVEVKQAQLAAAQTTLMSLISDRDSIVMQMSMQGC